MGNPFGSLARFGIMGIKSPAGARHTLAYILHGDGTGKELPQRVAIVKAAIARWSGKGVKLRGDVDDARRRIVAHTGKEPDADSLRILEELYLARGVVKDIYCQSPQPRGKDGQPMPMGFKAVVAWDRKCRGLAFVIVSCFLEIID